jgi:hypothetical protein
MPCSTIHDSRFETGNDVLANAASGEMTWRSCCTHSECQTSAIWPFTRLGLIATVVRCALQLHRQRKRRLQQIHVAVSAKMSHVAVLA